MIKQQFYLVATIVLFLISGSVIAQGKMTYVVITNDEGLHAIWSAESTLPDGWKATEISGSEAKCAKAIKRVWTDMRPLSIRKEFDKGAAYMVVINHEEQYMIWPARKDLPKGWKAGGASGTYGACQEYIEEVWTDMRPLSLRKRLEKG